MTILEPCCKKTQFSKFLRELHAQQKGLFTHYGDVNFTDWFNILILEAKGSDAHFCFDTLNFATLNYILNLMHEHAFLPGRNLAMLNHVNIQAKDLPEPLPQKAEQLIQEGRLIISNAKRQVKKESVTLSLPGNSGKLYRLKGNFFEEQPNTPRKIDVRIITLKK